MAEPLELKKTLNLPKTDFPMKASLPQNEPKQLAAWEEAHLYEKILETRKGKPLFVLHDGPPYPTGTIHLGTGLNKILKDMIVKSESMAGHYAPYVPGWDCHGLPIETQVEKELGGKGKVSAADFRKLCRQFATRYVEQHKKDFKRLGVFGRWNDPYLTMNFGYEATIAGAFLDFMEKGLRLSRPQAGLLVPPRHDRARRSRSRVRRSHQPVGLGEIRHRRRRKIPARTSAPSSGPPLPGRFRTTAPSRFIPIIDYAVVDTEKGALLLAADRVAALQSECDIKEARVRETFKGREFEGRKFQHPFLPLQVPGVLAEYVTLDQGSGIVHTAPGHGADDFYTGQKYGLETYAPLDDRGVYLEGLPEYKGKDRFRSQSRSS